MQDPYDVIVCVQVSFRNFCFCLLKEDGELSTIMVHAVRGQEDGRWWGGQDLTSVVVLIKVEYSAGDFFLFLMMVLMTAMLPDTTL